MAAASAAGTVAGTVAVMLAAERGASYMEVTVAAAKEVAMAVKEAAMAMGMHTNPRGRQAKRLGYHSTHLNPDSD